MGWTYVLAAACMVLIPASSVILLMAISTFVGTDGTGTDLERTALPVASFVAIYVIAGIAPGLVTIAVIVRSRRLYDEPLTGGMSGPAKAVIVYMSVWTVIISYMMVGNTV